MAGRIVSAVSALILVSSVLSKRWSLLTTGPLHSCRLKKERTRVQSRLDDARATRACSDPSPAVCAHEPAAPEADRIEMSNRRWRPLGMVAALAVGAVLAKVATRLTRRRIR